MQTNTITRSAVELPPWCRPSCQIIQNCTAEPKNSHHASLHTVENPRRSCVVQLHWENPTLSIVNMSASRLGLTCMSHCQICVDSKFQLPRMSMTFDFSARQGEYFHQIWSFCKPLFWTYEPEWEGQTDRRTASLCNTDSLEGREAVSIKKHHNNLTSMRAVLSNMNCSAQTC